MTRNIFDELRQLESCYSFNQDEVYYFNAHRSSELILQLQKRIETFDESVIPKIFNALGYEVSGWEVNKTFGTGHVIVFVTTIDGAKYVLRINSALNESEKYMGFEKYFAEQYATIGVPSTHIVHSDTSRTTYPFDYQIMEFLPGYDLKLAPDITEEDYERISHTIGAIVAKQFKLPMKGFGRIVYRDREYRGYYDTHNEYLCAYLDHDLEVIKLFNVINEEGYKTIYLFFTSNEVRELFKDTMSYLIHHDLADHNIRVEDKKLIAVYDWENAVAFDPLCELGSGPTWVSRYPREQKMIEGFLAEHDKEQDDFMKKIFIYRFRTVLWKMSLALKGKKLTQRHMNMFKQSLQDCGLEVIMGGQDWIVS